MIKLNLHRNLGFSSLLFLIIFIVLSSTILTLSYILHNSYQKEILKKDLIQAKISANNGTILCKQFLLQNPSYYTDNKLDETKIYLDEKVGGPKGLFQSNELGQQKWIITKRKTTYYVIGYVGKTYSTAVKELVKVEK